MALEFANESAGIAPNKPKGLLGPKGVSSADRLFLTEQLALMLENGMNLHSALTGLAKQTDKPALHEMITAIAEDVESGKSFSNALSRHPEVFDSTWVSLIAASEEGGFMYQVLEQLTRMEEKQTALRNHLVSALSYPAFLLFFSAAVVVFVLVVVFPKFGDMFAAIHDQLPATTIALMWASNMLTEYWIYLLATVAVMVWATSQWLNSVGGRELVDTWKLRTPVIREIMIQMYLAQAFRVLGLSLSNGVNVPDALHSSRDIVRNVRFRRFITEVESRVQEGSGIATAFEQADFIPPLVRQMVSTGEQTGNLAGVLTRVADFYERELARRLDRVSKLAEPVMLLVMGVVVGVLVSSLILPIFKLSRAVS